MRFLPFLIFFLLPLFGYSQDSVFTYQGESLQNRYLPKTFVRVGAGYQKSLYAEIGITRRKYSGEDLFVIGKAWYSSFEYIPKLFSNPSAIYGIKFGGEYLLQPLLLGAEAKYQTDMTNSDLLITPKIGLGSGNITGTTVSHLYFCYGYNISFLGRPFEGAGRHQFSFVFNPVNLSYLFKKKNNSKKLQ